MRSFLGAAKKMVPGPYPIDAATVAGDLGLARPVSLRTMVDDLDALPETISFHQEVLTPSGTALGGWVDVTLYPNGTYLFHWHMHDSGLDSYSFKLVAVVSSSDGVAFAAQQSGNVSGTLDIGSSRDFDVIEGSSADATSGRDIGPLIQISWSKLRAGSMTVSKAYQDTGVLGALESVVADLFDWLVASVKEAIGIIGLVMLGPELLTLSAIPGMDFAMPDLNELLAYSGQLFLWAFGAVVPAFAVGGIAKTRSLTQHEIDFVDRVFKGTVPYDRILLTNLTGAGGRAFTFPVGEAFSTGKILVNIGLSDEMYNDPTNSTWGAYSQPGEVLIHELTHAWQIANSNFVPGWVCDALSAQAKGAKAYFYGPPGPDYGTFNIEAQAAIVDQWFGGTRSGASGQQMDFNDPYFRYIAGNIWLGQS